MGRFGLEPVVMSIEFTAALRWVLWKVSMYGRDPDNKVGLFEIEKFFLKLEPFTAGVKAELTMYGLSFWGAVGF